MEAGAVSAANDFPTVWITVVVTGGFCPNLAAPLLEDGVSLIPQLFRNNGWDVGIWVHNPFTLVQKGFLFGSVIQRLGLVAAVPSLVLRVGQNMPDGQLIELITQQAGVSSPGQLLRDLSDSILPSGVEFKNEPHRLSLLRDNGQLAVLLIVPPQTVIAQNMTVLDGLSEPEFQTLGQLPHLILGHPCHHHQAKLAIRIQGIDVVILKENAHIGIQQFLSVLNAVQRTSGKSGDLFGNNEIKQAPVGVVNHPQKTFPLIGAGS